MIIGRDYFERDTLLVARDLIGCKLVSKTNGYTSGIIVETEAYLGENDPAAHSYKGRTERVRALYGKKGSCYIYLIYGIYWCLNISTGSDASPECVLIRALEPTDGIELMKTRRKRNNLTELCSGPGKLTKALNIDSECYGCDLCSEDSPIFLEYSEKEYLVNSSPRIGIDYAGAAKEFPWRFFASNNRFVSK